MLNDLIFFCCLPVLFFFYFHFRAVLYRKYAFGNDWLSCFVRKVLKRRKEKQYKKHVWNYLNNDTKKRYTSNELLEKIEEQLYYVRSKLPPSFSDLVIYYIPDKIKNGNATLKGIIIVKGDWTDLINENKEIANNKLQELYMLIGHELGHKDNEPRCSLFSKFQNHVREVRADYCGLFFAKYYGFKSDDIISIRFPDNAPVGKDCLTHPSASHRKYYLTFNGTNKAFSEEVIDEIAKTLNYKNNKKIKKLKKESFRGSLINQKWG